MEAHRLHQNPPAQYESRSGFSISGRGKKGITKIGDAKQRHTDIDGKYQDNNDALKLCRGISQYYW